MLRCAILTTLIHLVQVRHTRVAKNETDNEPLKRSSRVFIILSAFHVLERDERTFTDGGPYFHRRRLWMWTNALQPCWALLWFSDTCRRPLFLYDTLHPFLLWEYEHTCGQGLVIDGYIWKLPQCFSIILHMGSRKLLISSVFFFPFSFFAPWVRSSFCVTPAPDTPRLTLTFKPSEGCSSWISWAWFNWELHWATLCWCRNNPFHTFRQLVKNVYILGV